ncbi:hypothetical protein OCD90_11465 [Bacillus pacificus]|nr:MULTISPECIES: hypothetical protein [Bacillus cereus group]MCU5256382.1 hypothetical protein [Bacillus pacificus]WCA21734.1 hypothetical protein PGS39_28880 [Bacillus paranthracis]
MWKTVISYLPEWKVIMQSFIAFLIPYVIAKVCNNICKTKEE